MCDGADVCVGLLYRVILPHRDAEARPANDTSTNPSPSPNFPASKLHVLTAYYISLAESVERGRGLLNAVYLMTSGEW